MQIHPGLYIAPSSLGQRGVFTAAPIPKGSLLEICPVIVMPGAEREQLDQTGLYNYYFIWGLEDKKCAIVLGYGSIYNHSYQPAAEYRPDYNRNSLSFYAIEDIKAGEEITVNYSGNPEGLKKMWFPVKD
ncbi:MAG: SET domain-containing protein-lysine N-methyltransferase [Bacteroidetes bacterium]|nr:SET domain-containing protein-lysine N-methyltransferase [Bacteroidota bacterium]